MDEDALRNSIREQYFYWRNEDWKKMSVEQRFMNKKPHQSYEAYKKDIDGDIEELEKELKRCHKRVKYETQRTLNKLKRERDDFDSMIEKELQFWLTDQIIAMWYVPARKKGLRNHPWIL